MSDLPVLGAALNFTQVTSLKDWILEKDRCLELQDFSPVEAQGDDQDELITSYKSLLDGYKGTFGIHGPFFGLDLSSDDPLVQDVITKRYLDALVKCEKLGASHMVIHSPFNYFHSLNWLNFGYMKAAVFAAAQATLAPVVKRAEDIGCCLVLENVGDADPFLRKELAEAIHSDMFKLSIDTGHAAFAHGQFKAPPVTDFVLAADDMLAHVHLQDADGYADRHWHPGEGNIPWGGVFKAINDIPSEPRLILEVADRKELLPITVKRLEAQGLAQ
ncbi:TIM barrel protein [uncultured Cohaesibacter sp.]|uniref:sugar phosphate isomerase/epimerase family protein n=1 Tax=uncultured Cohaesibacter sp. TaxID=1002546 RepID=UPI00292F1735|nr:TIM barrel protein [uncultured Cohaesibacter sp.]